MASAPPAAAADKPVSRGRGVVKQVLSGDTLVVVDDKPSQQGPPPERTLTLSSLSAPRLSRGPKDDTEDQPFAWESREFVRKLAIGKKVFFAVDYVHPTSGREYCTVFLPGPASNEPGECLNNLIVAEGWATVFKSQASAKKADKTEALLQLEEQAIAQGKGIHTKDKSKAETRPAEVDADTLFRQLKGKPLNAVVEQVRTGSSVRVTLLPTRHTFQVLLSGVQAAGWKKQEGSTEPKPEPFAREAKYFVEQHVLQREVQLTLEGIAPPAPGQTDKTPSFSGSIEFQGHDVAEELLKAGLARYIAYSAAPRGNTWVQKLKAAEQLAKDNKRRLYADYKGPAAVNGTGNLPKEFIARVISVQNSGTIIVVPEGFTKEETISLSSIKVPRPGFPGDEEADEREPDKKKVEADRIERIWAAEGKELLRKRLIGQKVRVVTDYTRKAVKKEGEKELPEKTFYTVYQNDQNIAVILVESGLATVLGGKQGDERSMDFEVLLMAEGKAKAAHKGLHAPADKVPVRRINDLCVDSEDSKKRANQITRTKQFQASFERAGPMKAIVDYVFSGARFKVTVPKQSAVFMFTLSGLRVPKRGENAENDELSNQALLFSRERLHQFEVTIEVEGLDKGGNFVGSLYTNNKKNFAISLLDAGLAFVHYPSAERLRDGKELIAAENNAKAKKAGVWKNWDEEAEKARLAALAETETGPAVGGKPGQPQNVEVVVTEVVDGARLYVQVVGQEAAGLDELVHSLTELSLSEGGGLPLVNPKVGDLVRGQFSEDQQWYRAKVLEVSGSKYKLQYIDYGNTEYVPAERIRLLPPNFHALPAQAQFAGLAFVKPLKEDNESYGEAKQYLKEIAGGKKLIGAIEYRDQGVIFLTLEDTAEGFNITQEMLRVGLARLERRRRRFLDNPTYLALRTEEDKAKSKHVGIWYLGDIPDSDEDEAPGVRSAPKGGKPVPAAAGAKEAAAPAPAPKKK